MTPALSRRIAKVISARELIDVIYIDTTLFYHDIGVSTVFADLPEYIRKAIIKAETNDGKTTNGL